MNARHILVGLALVASSATAQLSQSPSYKFLEAVRNSKNDDVTNMLDTPGQTLINSRDRTTGEGALHIVIKRGDSLYLRYLLTKGADPNLRDGKGNTPLMLAIEGGQNDLVDILLRNKANPNLGNSGGETPLIRAVQKRDLNLVRVLLNGGADPDQTDNLAGQSARDYAHNDDRATAIAKVIDETPKKARRAVSGPRL
ncbi:Ankyrin [Sphingomonas sp. EC-HK361]|uniref:ankyrin repeat domain-containing protein n=1 Tax=Sphingomonas sp. EC-HK361 TaxID=2038397 RepID=UPI00125721D7|nr:ankyrin repeat domain-containing protein [Sphingomonas sp. EC-HK361]VVT06428.1 Ankyrin [Sphingomonas sp. EC-HK361]